MNSMLPPQGAFNHAAVSDLALQVCLVILVPFGQCGTRPNKPFRASRLGKSSLRCDDTVVHGHVGANRQGAGMLKSHG
jgi:hypothetical protein